MPSAGSSRPRRAGRSSSTSAPGPGPASRPPTTPQVIGLWRCTGDPTGGGGDDTTGAVAPGSVRSLLLTRKPSLAVWERSKLPRGAAEAAVRGALSRRYDLCTSTVVHTTTPLTAADAADRARWASGSS